MSLESNTKNKVFEILAKEGRARLGKLQTAHGSIETPFFMPAATKASGKLITTDDYKQAGVKTMICNALLLSLKPGIELLRKAGGVHKFMNFKGVVFTDCGGFQMSRSIFEKKSKKGLHFRDPYNNSRVVLTPKRIMEIELSIDSDVAMMLDDMSGWGCTREQAEIAIENTHRWGKQSIEWHKKWKQEDPRFRDSKQLLFGIIQGNFFADLREKSAKFINSLDFDGIAIGGLAIGEPKEEMHKAIDAALPHVREDKPRYVMGVGSPLEILDLVAKGIDCFDSVYPTQVARHFSLFTRKGIVVIDQLRYSEDFSPIEEGCECHTCQDYTKAYVHHLIKVKEPIGKRLLSIHNTYFMQKLLSDIREAIREGRFSKFKAEFEKGFGRCFKKIEEKV